MSVILEGISCHRGQLQVLCDLDLVITDGEWVAIIGATGSGKSTLAEILAGLRRPQRGRLLIDGRDIWKRGGSEYRRRLGLVMQQADDQFLGRTVFEDIAFGPRHRGADAETVERQVAAALDAVGFAIDEVRDRAPQEFSGGQRRRLALAAVLVLGCSVLVLDEPLAGLDPQARIEVVSLLTRLRLERGMTIISLASDLDLCGEATLLSLLVHGQIGLTGTLPDFIANQRLLREAGIMLPERIQLVLALRECGWNVPVLADGETIAAAIAAEWRRRARA
jgi:energy-coupling factor transporter ATP-binding protein EcfA2